MVPVLPTLVFLLLIFKLGIGVSGVASLIGIIGDAGDGVVLVVILVVIPLLVIDFVVGVAIVVVFAASYKSRLVVAACCWVLIFLGLRVIGYLLRNKMRIGGLHCLSSESQNVFVGGAPQRDDTV